MTDFGVRLKQAMKEKGMTASELSRASGVGKNLISYYINGVYLAKQDKVFMLAKALDVDPGWLITGVEPEKEDLRARRTITLPDATAFSRMLNYMSPEDYDALWHIFDRTHKKMQEKGIAP